MTNKESNSRYDWPGAEAYFVHGEPNEHGGVRYPSYKDVALRFFIDVGYVRKVAAKDDWKGKREQAKKDYADKLANQQTELRLKKAKEFQEDCIGLAEQGLNNLRIHINKIVEKAQANGGKLDPMSLKDLESLSKSLEKLQKVGSVALGIPDSNVSKTISGPNNGPVQLEWLKDVKFRKA